MTEHATDRGDYEPTLEVTTLSEVASDGGAYEPTLLPTTGPPGKRTWTSRGSKGTDFSRALLRRLVEAGGISVGLALRGRELTGRGYFRQTPQRWRLDRTGAVVRAKVSFGPFLEDVEYDSGLLMVGNDAEVVNPGPVKRIGVGMALDYEASLELA